MNVCVTFGKLREASVTFGYFANNWLHSSDNDIMVVARGGGFRSCPSVRFPNGTEAPRIAPKILEIDTITPTFLI